jgi:hypothetical protein
MFAQVIQGKTSDPDGLQAAIDRWIQELAPGAIGWLGTTGGTTEDGRTIAVVRFESEEAARRNSERPEQDQWWAETAKLFDGEATFRDSSDLLIWSVTPTRPASCRSCRDGALTRSVRCSS